MQVSSVSRHRVPTSPSTAPAVAALLTLDCDREGLHVAIPHPHVHVVARFGPMARGGLDLHALGGRHSAHRKVLRSGQRTVMARLHLGASQAVLGAPPSVVADRIVALEDLWGEAATERLRTRLSDARDSAHAAAILEGAIADRPPTSTGQSGRARLAMAAVDGLARANVNAVALDLGVSERHLRRVFHETFGMNPKAFAKLSRFHRALDAARLGVHAGWASIAAAAGYYDQAHLIAEFRAIAGVTPHALLGELRGSRWIG